MKTIKFLFSLFITTTLFLSCNQDEDNIDFLDNAAAPTNVSAAVSITQDNTGLVTMTPLAEGVSSFNIVFGDGSEDSGTILPGESTEHTYEEGTYEAVITASALNGKTTSITQTIVVSFQAPQNLEVTIENDAAISKQVNVTATADFAMFFEVDFGDGSNLVQANIGETASHTYQNAGLYTIIVTAMGGAIETTTYTEVDFEVTEIVQPLAAASTPPNRADEDVISVFSNAYTNISGVDFFPNWGQSTTYNLFDLGGDEMLQYTNLNYQGIDFSGTPIDASQMEYLHVDIWTADENDAKISPISPGPNETAYDLDLTAQQWTSFDIPLSFFTDQNPLVDLASIIQFKFDGVAPGGAIFVDNLYFYRADTSGNLFDDGLLTNGDFENGSDSWIVGVDDNSPAPTITDAGNTHYAVNVASAGNPWDVNTSQKVEIIQGNTYTLTFDAWSDVNRSIVSGIGLSADPWSSSTETVNITTTRTTYSLTLSSADFGAMDARVIFDLGAETGTVNLDNVSLIIGTGNILTNGDFENGSDPWIVGVDDNSPAPIATDAGNTYYSVNVATAGNAFDVNVSQKVEIIQGNSYTLTFDAWSDANRSIVAGIGLSADPWSNSNETVNITATRTTYTITLLATDFGAADARVLFDVGAETGLVNIDDVSLSSN